MSETRESGQQDAERARLRAFWAGDRDAPFVMERSKLECDCHILLPSFRDHAALVLRYIVLGIGRLIPSSALKIRVLRLTGMRIGRDVTISPGVSLDPLWPFLIEIGDGAVLGMGCRVLTHECTVRDFRIGRTRIGKHSVIGAGATVRAGVTIGERVTVGCNSFVNSDVPDGETVGGVPARPLKGQGELA